MIQVGNYVVVGEQCAEEYYYASLVGTIVEVVHVDLNKIQVRRLGRTHIWAIQRVDALSITTNEAALTLLTRRI